MMNVDHAISYILFLLCLLCSSTLGFPNSVNPSRQGQDENDSSRLQFLDPEVFDDDTQLDRMKRKLPDAHFGAKNAVVGFIFGDTHKIMSNSSHLYRGSEVEKNSIPLTKYNNFNMDVERIQLDIPDGLFSSSFTTVTNISKIFGSFLMNSAKRYAKLMEILKPFFGKTLKL